MRRIRSSRVQFFSMHIAALVAICMLLLAPHAHAATLNQAGLMVDYGDGSTSWVLVPFEEDEISIEEMLQRSELEIVTVGFGGMGEAVCQIGPTGCGVDDCRRKLCQTSVSSPFWRLMILDGDQWRPAGRGVSGTNVGDGDVVALSWSGTEPELPILSINDIAANAGAEHASRNVVTRTEGQESGDKHDDAWLPAVGALGTVAAVAGVLIYRAKSQQGDA